jgi:hypothetical protein
VPVGDEGDVIPGVGIVNLRGHTPGRTSYLLGEGDDTILFWGDTVHSHAMQLRRPQVAVAIDSDEPGAVTARRKVLDVASSNRWWVGAPTSRSQVSGISAAIRTATAGCRSPSHPSPNTSTRRHGRSSERSLASATVARHRFFFADSLVQRQRVECDATQPTNGVDNVASALIVAHVVDILILVIPIQSAPPIGFPA